MIEKERPKYLDPKEFYKNELDSWQSLWDENLNFYENIYNILTQAVFLPDKLLLAPIASTYVCIPSKWSKIVPILFSWGDKGSGKSTIANFANYLHGFPQGFVPTDTFASIRNDLDAMRWMDPANKDYEREGALLAWDNLHAETLLSDPKLYQLLLVGYSRATEKMRVASQNGQNLYYYVFCPKIMSSIDAIHLLPEFTELKRRLIVVPHKVFEKFSPEDKKDYEGISIKEDRLDLDSINWQGFQENFYLFWNTPENCAIYASWRNFFTKKGKKSFKIPDEISGEQWTISIDLMVTGLVIGTWNSPAEAISHMARYWQFSNEKIFQDGSATLAHLENFINEETGAIININEQIVQGGGTPHDVIISAQRLKDRLTYLQSRGELDINPKQKDINIFMWQLGWKLTTKGWKQR